MGSILAVFFAWLAQLQMLPTGMELQKQATQTETAITTAQQESLILNAAGSFIQQNLSAVQASSTPSSPYIITVPQLVAANIGANSLPAGFNSLNPYGQTWQVQVLQPTPGNLEALVIGVNNSASTMLTDMQAAEVASHVGQAGGFVPQNDSGIYPSGAVYGNAAGWRISSGGFANISGGQPTALLAINNGQQQSLALMRVAVPGQPQVNTMSTALNMGGNSITNGKDVQLASGEGVVIGNTALYGDDNNAAVRADGGLYVQKRDMSPADIMDVRDIHASGDYTGNNISATGTIWTNSNLLANGYLEVQGPATPGGFCSGPLVGAGPNGILLCKNNQWSSGLTMTSVSSGGWAAAGTATCPSGTIVTGGSCDMFRGGDGRAINAQYCQPSGNGYACNEGNGGNCIAHAMCAS